jgi:serine/threonine protein kinase
MPSEEDRRESLLRSQKLFFQEAKAMAALRHPNLVAVRGLFLANDTGYLVMQYERGRNLGQFVHSRGGGLSTTLIMRIFLPVLDALALFHARSMLHLDVKPGNIHLRNGHDPLLLDLGAVHLMSAGSGGGSQVITAGYSPPEQYHRSGDVGPWTDVYAVGASIRCCMEGKTPQPAPERLLGDQVVPAVELLHDRYPSFLLEATDWAMQLKTSDRPRDAGALLARLREHQSILPDSALRELIPGERD